MLEQKLDNLKQRLQALKRVVVAFSGGVDSTLLLKVCMDILGKDHVLAVTAYSEAFSEKEFMESQDLAEFLNVRQIVIESAELDIPGISDNPPERCYFCKRYLFSRFTTIAREQGYNFVVEGSNFSDTEDFRPGMVAIQELGIISPLKEAGLTKDEIRKASKAMGLPTWNKPSYACLFSRFPYGEKITREKLKRVSEAENLLRGLGFYQFRVRSHGDLARIEVLPEEIERFFEQSLRDTITKELRKMGFTYITLDLTGYRTGSMNEELKEEDRAVCEN
ncbi:MAG TPA: ATP-dependent sacrificial sulfur transferase LarE [Thermoanaerobacterales bacterium]|nr:ATP-dependent sacrificial sulfur transferase LarE [Thermoanaerobacterales bacterium]